MSQHYGTALEQPAGTNCCYSQLKRGMLDGWHASYRVFPPEYTLLGAHVGTCCGAAWSRCTLLSVQNSLAVDPVDHVAPAF